MWNFVSATTAIIGFFVGAGVSTNENARQWIFAVTIGMFLYIALVDLVHRSRESTFLIDLFYCFCFSYRLCCRTRKLNFVGSSVSMLDFSLE